MGLLDRDWYVNPPRPSRWRRVRAWVKSYRWELVFFAAMVALYFLAPLHLGRG